jgi:hypothetical protein
MLGSKIHLEGLALSSVGAESEFVGGRLLSKSPNYRSRSISQSFVFQLRTRMIALFIHLHILTIDNEMFTHRH